jgi:type VI protein secretion system component VasF
VTTKHEVRGHHGVIVSRDEVDRRLEKAWDNSVANKYSLTINIFWWLVGLASGGLAIGVIAFLFWCFTGK